VSITFGRAPKWRCSEQAEHAVELYRAKGGLAHGDLGARLYVCDGHVDQAKAVTWMGENVSPFVIRNQVINETACGYLVDYRDSRPRDTTSSAEEVPETQDVVAPSMAAGTLAGPRIPYRLTFNGRMAVRGTLREVRAAVAELVTTRLAAAPERMFSEAHAVNALFNEGYVEREIAERGEWFTVLDGQGPDPQHIRVAKE
jgi:hypothetical protein